MKALPFSLIFHLNEEMSSDLSQTTCLKVFIQQYFLLCVCNSAFWSAMARNCPAKILYYVSDKEVYQKLQTKAKGGEKKKKKNAIQYKEECEKKQGYPTCLSHTCESTKRNVIFYVNGAITANVHRRISILWQEVTVFHSFANMKITVV